MNEAPESIDEYRAVLATLSDDEAVYAAHAVFALRARSRRQRLAREQTGTQEYLEICEASMSRIEKAITQRCDQ